MASARETELELERARDVARQALIQLASAMAGLTMPMNRALIGKDEVCVCIASAQRLIRSIVPDAKDHKQKAVKKC